MPALQRQVGSRVRVSFEVAARANLSQLRPSWLVLQASMGQSPAEGDIDAEVGRHGRIGCIGLCFATMTRLEVMAPKPDQGSPPQGPSQSAAC